MLNNRAIIVLENTNSTINESEYINIMTKIPEIGVIINYNLDYQKIENLPSSDNISQKFDNYRKFADMKFEVFLNNYDVKNIDPKMQRM